MRFTTAAALVSELIESRDEKKLLRLQKLLASYELPIVEELGFVPLSKTGAELLFEVFSQRYERSSTRPAKPDRRWKVSSSDQTTIAFARPLPYRRILD